MRLEFSINPNHILFYFTALFYEKYFLGCDWIFCTYCGLFKKINAILQTWQGILGKEVTKFCR